MRNRQSDKGACGSVGKKCLGNTPDNSEFGVLRTGRGDHGSPRTFHGCECVGFTFEPPERRAEQRVSRSLVPMTGDGSRSPRLSLSVVSPQCEHGTDVPALG